MYRDSKLWPTWYRSGPVDAQALLSGVARDFGLSMVEIQGPVRCKELMGPRSVVARILRERGRSYPTIGRLMHRDHTSIMNCVDRFDVYARQDPRVNEIYERWRVA